MERAGGDTGPGAVVGGESRRGHRARISGGWREQEETQGQEQWLVERAGDTGP